MDHRAWRVVASNPVPEVDWSEEDREALEIYRPETRADHAPWVTVLRPVEITADDPRSRDHDQHMSWPVRSYGGFDVYENDHYPVCAQCGEPAPCREEMARTIGEAAEKDAARYEIGGVCPACQEIPTARHKVLTFEENLRVPFGPPVTFHVGRRQCRYLAAKYEREWADGAPGRRTELTCPGDAWRHVDGFDCSEGDDCRGIKTEHRHVQHCDSRCSRCRDAREAAQDAITRRNAAGDWTTW